jgi:monofunctional biosynthetic peptidoglycan transglycosylase
MGNGVFGIEAAAEKYFNKPAKNLSKQEAALIAACLPSPRRYIVSPASRFMLQRSIAIQRQMDNLHTDPDVQRVTGIAPP